MSVGEVVSIIPLIRILRADDPLLAIYLSTSTKAGREAAQAQAATLVSGIFYCPLDYVSCVRRVLRTIKPALLVVLETEIWPNLYVETKRSGAKLAIVNGRISDQTWPRYSRWKKWVCPILKLPDLVLVQSSLDCERYARLGTPAGKLRIEPNLKYDASLSLASVHIETFDAQHVWIAASTVGPNERGSLSKHSVDEDDIVIAAFESLAREFPKLLLIIAPRQPARFSEVAGKLDAGKVSFTSRTLLQSTPGLSLQLPGVLLLDTMGELSSAYRLADVAFVGGSLAPRGGHNILEPAAAGVPIVVGPHMQNFASIAEDFTAADALVQIEQAGDLLPAIRELLVNPGRARELGAKGLALVTSRQGVSRRVSERLWFLYRGAAVREIQNPWRRAFLTPLKIVWQKGGDHRRTKSERLAISSRSLPVPVVSVGGITVGGAGKTPFATYLVNRLKYRGQRPAVLTRGYRRRLPTEHLVSAAGVSISPALTGDEAQIFLRIGDAPIGVGAKRYETAQILLRQFPSTDVLVLDDGFQHARLHRDFDIVLIDGLDPFGGEEVIPLGRLREPLHCLRRAHAFVVTRAENDWRFRAISQRLRDIHPAAPIFRTRLVARAWRDYRDGQVVALPKGTRVGAFCGLGNTENFWQTLDSLGLNVVFRWPFPDHHVYKPFELQRVAHQSRMQGADVLVTTEKDRVNCPSHLERLISPLNLVWLEIELVLDDEAGFFAALEKVLLSRSWRTQFTR